MKVSKTLRVGIYFQDGTMSMDGVSKKGDEEDGKKKQKTSACWEEDILFL